MSNVITGGLNYTKIDKSIMIRGKQGDYFDIVLIPTPNDKYGNDFMVVQGISQERRAAGERGEILGNAKMMGPRSETTAYQPPAYVEPNQADPPSTQGNLNPAMNDDDIPF
jgi:hypothetical protein